MGVYGAVRMPDRCGARIDIRCCSHYILDLEVAMRKPMTIRIDTDVLEAAKTRARRENRTVTNYIETVLRRDLRMNETSEDVEVYAPADVRQYRVVPDPGETKEQTEIAERAL